MGAKKEQSSITTFVIIDCNFLFIFQYNFLNVFKKNLFGDSSYQIVKFIYFGLNIYLGKNINIGIDIEIVTIIYLGIKYIFWKKTFFLVIEYMQPLSIPLIFTTVKMVNYTIL